MIIQKFELSDIEPIKYLQPEGWDDITPHFRFFHEKSFCYPVVAMVDARIIGVANGILNVGTGWLSHIIVAPDYRGKGIGYQLTEHIMTYLSNNGCKTQLLIATELGEPVYRKLGFKTVGYYCFHKGLKLNITAIDPNIRQLHATDVDAMYELDRKVTGEIRAHMLQGFLANGWIYDDGRSHELQGYFLSELGEGTIIATDRQAGVELLKLKHSIKGGKAVLPQENKAGRAFLESNGFTPHLTAARMILGEKIQWQPQLIFSRIGGHYG